MRDSEERHGGQLSRLSVLLLPYLALVLVHLFTGLQMEQPLILADELGYLGNARYLSGTAHLPDMRGTQFYHFGYSLFLFPAFWLFAEPTSIYRAAIVVNALLASSLYFPLRYILVSFVHVSERTARWIAFACCLYPSIVLYANFAWSENAYVPFYALAVALFGKFLSSKSPRDALLFSLVAGFLYTIHPRALPVLAAILLYLIVLAVLKVIAPRQLLLSVLTMGSIFAATRVVNEHLKATGWAGEGDLLVSKLAERIVPGSELVALLERASGQALYLSLASHGLFLLGLMAMIWLVVRNMASQPLRRVLAEPVTAVPIFVLLTGSGVFVGACLSKLYSLHGASGLRGGNFIHGRYNEAFAVLCIAFALGEYSVRGRPTRQVVRRLIVVIAVILCLTVVVMTEIGDALKRQVADTPGAQPRESIPPSRVDTIAVPGIYPLVRVAGGLKLYAISIFVMASFLTVTLVMGISKRGGVALLVLLFASFSYFNHRYYLMPLKARAGHRLNFAAEVLRGGAIAEISYDAAYRKGGFVAGLQFLLQHTVFHRFDSRLGQVPRTEAVISGDDWRQAGPLGARFIASSGARRNTLWILPGELESRITSAPYEGSILGAEAIPGVREAGFHRSERFDGEPGRWTKGTATLEVPVDPRRPPQGLEIEAISPGRDGVSLRVLANGIELWNEQIPPERWSRAFSLEPVPLDQVLLIELTSDTFSPAETTTGSSDTRKLGIVVRGIRLTWAETEPE